MTNVLEKINNGYLKTGMALMAGKQCVASFVTETLTNNRAGSNSEEEAGSGAFSMAKLIIVGGIMVGIIIFMMKYQKKGLGKAGSIFDKLFNLGDEASAWGDSVK